MSQSWRRLLFAHWPVAPEALAPVVPPQLPIDTFEGRAWVAVTPFEVRGFRLRLTPPLPGVSSFTEINVRTYVTVGGRPGIYFLSLDADSRPAVAGARRFFRVPYFRAAMKAASDEGQIRFESERHVADAFVDEFDVDGQLRRNERGERSEGERLVTQRFFPDAAPVSIVRPFRRNQHHFQAARDGGARRGGEHGGTRGGEGGSALYTRPPAPAAFLSSKGAVRVTQRQLYGNTL